MNSVCCSVKEVLDMRFKDMQDRIQKKSGAIFGMADYRQSIITERALGVRPKLSGEIITESDPVMINTLHHGMGCYGHRYNIKRDLTRADFAEATKDDIYLFVAMVHPKTMKREGVKETIIERLSVINQQELENSKNKEELQNQHKEELEKVEYICDSLKKAVNFSNTDECTYFPEGYKPDPHM